MSNLDYSTCLYSARLSVTIFFKCSEKLWKWRKQPITFSCSRFLLSSVGRHRIDCARPQRCREVYTFCLEWNRLNWICSANCHYSLKVHHSQMYTQDLDLYVYCMLKGYSEETLTTYFGVYLWHSSLQFRLVQLHSVTVMLLVDREVVIFSFVMCSSSC